MRRTPVSATFAVLASIALSGCKGTGGSAARPVPQATLAWNDAGGASLTIGERTAPVPAGDLRLGATPPVDHDEAGTRFSYVAADERIRVVYAVGDGLYFAKPGEAHAGKAPETLAALGGLFEAATPRERFVSDVKKALGEPGLVRMLVDGADVEAPEWPSTLASLPAARAEEVRSLLAETLEPGKPTRGMKRAVALLPLAELAKRPGFAARAAEPRVQADQPRAAAAMIRALAAADAVAASSLACDALERAAGADAGAPPVDAEGKNLLLEAAALTLAKAAPGGRTCPALSALLADACTPHVRCGADGPLTGRETTKQDEPLCSPPELGPIVLRELQRPIPEVVAGTSATRTTLFAYAALVASSAKDAALPAPFVLAHARRRYALSQPETPSCDGAEIGRPCRCDEPMVRDQACRNEPGGLVRVGVCAFTVDDASKRITNVVASAPP